MAGGLPRICLVSASGENVFFGEILDAFGDALREHGYSVERSVDTFPAPADDLVCLVIPHEYVALVDPLAHPTPEQLRRTVAISTEQPGTAWFETAVGVAERAGAVVDINRLAAKEMGRRGIRADHVQLGYIPSWDVWKGEDSGEREYDMTFLGRHTEARAKAVARCVPALERRRAAIYMTETLRPHVAGSSYFLAGRRRSELFANSKVLMNVHQQKLPYLEWHRILSAVLNGCAVLSEHSLMTEPLTPGEHFVSARPEDLPLVLEAMLSDPERTRAVRDRAYDLVRREMPMSAAVEILVEAIERADAEKTNLGPLGAAPPVPLPKELPHPKPGWEAWVDEAGEQLPTRRALKDLVARTRRLERRVEELTQGGEENTVTVEQLGPEHAPPRVSVLLTVYNHADLVGNAIRSVAFGEVEDIELIAVDDASTDDSADVVREVCAEAPWLDAKLVQRSVNSGLPAVARNCGLEHARGELVFILDADNTVLPLGIPKLAAALEGNPEAAFAYGIIEKFDAGGPVGLESWIDWDPTRLPYGNYIDAMALIRRSALEEVGGYPDQQSLAGWEDFGLWLAMAEAGMGGIRVPDVVGRYRVSQYSMLSITGIDHSTAWTTLLRKYPKTMRVAG
ncbi:MAG TPA: glycosyltransferase [Solirubrobacterales bacterium]|nr:glycosyltransferase [Solirubrobacterales bacterium]